MTFINEYISKKDWNIYNFDGLDNGPSKGITGSSFDWTINREANIWIRHFYTESDHTEPDGGYTGVVAWNYYWKGIFLVVEIKSLACGGGEGKAYWTKQKLLSINIPPELENQRKEIIHDFERAYSERVGGLVYWENKITHHLL